MELLLDLGLIDRTEASRDRDTKKEFVWVLNEAGVRMARNLEGISFAPGKAAATFDQSFFALCSDAYGYKMSGSATTDRETLFWFAQAFKLVGREYGFTPGRTLAITASLLAIEHGRLLELGTVADCVYRAAKNEFSKFLKFSGGSRFDREFLMRVQPGLEEYCVESCKAAEIALPHP
jgi:hypothetical protein